MTHMVNGIHLPTDSVPPLCQWCHIPIEEIEGDWIHCDSHDNMCNTSARPTGSGSLPVRYADTCRNCHRMWGPRDIEETFGRYLCGYRCDCGHRWNRGYSVDSSHHGP